MNSIEQQIVKKILEDVDMSKFKPAIERAVEEYFMSDSFADDVTEAMSENGVGYELANAIAKKMIQECKKRIKVSL